MGMPHASAIWTADRVRTLPEDGKRYEAVDGQLLVTPAPGVLHQRAVSELGFLLRSCFQPEMGLEILHSPADIEMDDRTLVQPDLFITRRVTGENPSWKSVAMLLAIEVLSPTTARYDRVTKRGLYQRQGIEYWIVDLDGRIVERWRPEEDRPEILTETIDWRSPESDVVCAIDLATFFRGVLA